MSLGEGVYLDNNSIYAGIIGKTCWAKVDGEKTQVSIVPLHAKPFGIAVKIRDEVLARVTKIKEETIFLEILSVNNKPTSGKLEGVIKKRDIREKEIDKIVLEKCFIPGDIVKARVCSYGDSRKVQLSTSEDDLGVIYATNQLSGNIMIPVNEEDMKCPISGSLEKRKVAIVC
jgi:exosome complex component CSL4